MARYTQAYREFLGRVGEIDAIIQLALQLSRPRASTDEARRGRAVCRGGVVLLCSHIEGYIEDLAEVIVDRIVQRQLRKDKLSPTFLYQCSHDLIAQIRETSDPERIAPKVKDLVRRDQDIWNDEDLFVQPLPHDRIVAGFATPNTEKIRKFWGRFGYTHYDGDLRSQLRADYAILTNMVDQVVDQRNKIAHGDHIVTGTPSDLRNMTTLVTKFCRTTDDVVARWFRGQGCSIR